MEMTDQDRANIHGIINETIKLAQMDGLRALSIAIVKPDGQVRVISAIAQGGYAISLLAATDLAHMEVYEQLRMTSVPTGQLSVPAKLDS